MFPQLRAVGIRKWGWDWSVAGVSLGFGKRSAPSEFDLYSEACSYQRLMIGSLILIINVGNFFFSQMESS